MRSFFKPEQADNSKLTVKLVKLFSTVAQIKVPSTSLMTDLPNKEAMK